MVILKENILILLKFYGFNNSGANQKNGMRALKSPDGGGGLEL
jgi:hypothetical protein